MESPPVLSHVSPFFQGRIACANVLSDLYAMGVTECDNMLMLLGISNKMTDRVSRRWASCLLVCCLGHIT